ncbi:hypothetical protein MJO28_010786 [Puccinia striiformis f. sp. tritici]|uniref:Uncharacterized protein n=1 Tax=Puccinia striiformis f. sp. tritici TaxID=168172 RepID=A0ACC0E6T5_9BASI|nr:hypothetical protein MJO28_010786 [Puccinia striiformis f. sp. tritici]
MPPPQGNHIIQQLIIMNQDNPSSSKLQPGTQVQVGQYVVQVEKFLSEGGFAHVYVASLVSPSNVEGFPASQNRFVLKRMAVPDKPGLVEVRKEVDVMKQLRPHKHIVYFIEASASSIPGSNGYEIFILMEWCPGGGIIDLLNSRLQNRLTESEILKIFSDTVSAVAHMHSQNPILIHRDLKIDLLSKPPRSKTFSLPRPTSTSSVTLAPPPVHCLGHLNPQQRSSPLKPISTSTPRFSTEHPRWWMSGVGEASPKKQAHIWALGVFLYKLCYYTTPFEAHGPLAIMNVQYQIPSYPAYSNSVKYLIGTMLQELAQSRPDIWEVHQHVCRLRGITPNLRRMPDIQKPSRKHSISNVSSLPPLSDSALPKPTHNKPNQDGLDSIFVSSPSTTVSKREPESVVPMRRGRPGVKSKLEAPVPNGDTFPQSIPSASTNFPSKKESPPEESDLFAREAAAGFGDAFLSLSPQINSFKPIIRSNPSVNTSSGTGLITSRSHLSLKSTALTPTSRQDIVKSSSSSAFEDLVPLTKKTTPKTLNEMRSGLGIVTTTSTGPSFGPARASTNSSFAASKPRLHQYEHSHSSSIGSTASNLLQKTGPQTLPSHSSQPQQQSGYLKMSITQKTGPAIGSVTRPSMSDWLQKDQPILVSRSTQTSPSLLSGWMVHELTLAPPFSNVSNGHLKSKNTTVTTTTHHHKQSLDTGYQHTTRRENDRIQQTSASILDDSRSTRRVQEPGSFLMPQQPSAKAATTAAQELSSESDSSDEEPEDPDGRGRTAYRGPVHSLAIKPAFKPKPSMQTGTWEPTKGPMDHRLAVGGPSSSNKLNPTPHKEMTTDPSGYSIDSAGELSSSEATTEEDEEVKQVRRAAIAKFAPAATTRLPKQENDQPDYPTQSSEPSSPRDPFSSRAAQTPIESKPLTIHKVSENQPVPQRRGTTGPPIRAPKPQCLKSAAAINNLVSRYENLSSSTSSDTSSIMPASSHHKRQSIFKPTSSSSTTTTTISKTPASKADHHHSLIGGSSSSSKAPVHIPKNSLGPGIISNIPPISDSNINQPHHHSSSSSSIDQSQVKDDNHDHDQDDDDKFTSVNDLKSKWESGAVKSSNAFNKNHRVLRSDYGQTS